MRVLGDAYSRKPFAAKASAYPAETDDCRLASRRKPAPLTKLRCAICKGDHRSPLQKDTLPMMSSDFLPAFLCRKEAQRKANKRNALFQRKLFEKSFLWTLSKTFPRCRRNVGRAHPKLRTSRPAAPQGAPRVPFHSLIYLAAVSAAWVRASSGAAPCRIAAANPAKKLSPAPTVV